MLIPNQRLVGKAGGTVIVIKSSIFINNLGNSGIFNSFNISILGYKVIIYPIIAIISITNINFNES